MSATGTIAGEVKKVQIFGDRTRILGLTVTWKDEGFGAAAGKTFTKLAKVVMFGKYIDEKMRQIPTGTIVECFGRFEVDEYKGRDGSSKTILKMVANSINVLKSTIAAKQAVSEYENDAVSGAPGGYDPAPPAAEAPAQEPAQDDNPY